MLGEVVFEPRFCGPPASANGGYAAGTLAAYVDAPVVEVRLAAPPPLERPLAVVAAGDGIVELRDRDALVALARPGELEVAVPRRVTLEEAERAGARPLWREGVPHPFPTCFGCGPLRHRGDALRHLCGPLDDRDVVACPMTTDASLPHGEDGALAPPVVWAALDCPTAAGCVPVGSPAHVLGTFTVRTDHPIQVGEPHAVMAWSLGSDERKKYGASAIVDGDGRVAAVAAAVWIELRQP